MTLFQWFIFFLILQIIHGLGTWKLYENAGRKSWVAFIPIYNAIELMKIINRPTWWTILLFIPIINLIMFPVVWVETLRSFGKNTTKDTLLGIFTFGFYIYYVNYTQKVNHILDRSLTPKTKTGDTVSSLLFAIVVATLVHTYVMQPYTIPTSSLEKSLLIGDFLFVSKFHYGARTPMTTVAAPMVHDTLPIIKTKSYLNFPQLPYFRFPRLQEIKNNDIVVFNWPVDTVYKFFDKSGRRANKPVDKKSNYVKRCIAIAGDSLLIKNQEIYINNKKLILPERAKPQFYYGVTTKNQLDQNLLDRYDVREFWRYYRIQSKLWDNDVVKKYIKDNHEFLSEVSRDTTMVEVTGYVGIEDMGKLQMTPLDNKLNMNLSSEKVALMKNDPEIASVQKFINPADPTVFPQNKKLGWSIDNFGPIYIPKAGKTVALTTETLPFYKRIITDYEKGNDLKVMGNDIYINGKKVTTYTFAQDYFWMMGDNRHNSEDSRFWGFVPEDHIVGKPVFIWMSYDTNGKGFNKIRWERMFTTVGGDGQPQSYFQYFLMALAAYFGISYFLNKRKK